MAATVAIRVYNGASAGTPSGDVTGIDMVSADNATNSSGNRAANPIAVGTRSYEKWLKAVVTAPPANSVGNFKMWGDGGVQASTDFFFTSGYVTGATPTSGTSTVANTDFTNFTSGAKATWDAATYGTSGAATKYAVFQLAVDSDCLAGNWTQEVISYSYDET